MSEQASYRLQIDWDRDGYFNTGVDPDDPLNLVPSPVLFHGLYFYPATSSSTASRDREVTDYGLYVWSVSTGGDADGGILIGQNEAAPTMLVIPVLPGAVYTVQVWVKRVSAAGDADLRIDFVDPETDTVVDSADFTPTVDWEAYTLTATAAATQRWVRIDLRKQTTADLVMFKATGLMVVEGAQAPTAFNAGAASNPYDDIWAFCESVTLSYGIPQYTEAVAPPSNMTVSANNIDGVFAPENPPPERSGAVQNTVTPVIVSASVFGTTLEGDSGSWTRASFFSRGMLARLQADYDGTTYTLYIGTLDSLRADAGAFGSRRASLKFIDPTTQLNTAQYDPPLQEAVTTDEVLERIFDSGTVLYPYPAAFWLLGVSGASELGVSTWLFENRLTDFDVGETTLAFAGDTTGAGNLTSALEFIREIVYAELGGRFFWDAPSAQFKFFRRTREIFYLPTVSAPGVLELEEPPEYVWADDLLNKVTVTYYPRVVGLPNSVMYALGNAPMTLAAGQSRQMTVRYQIADAPNASIAGKDMNPPLPGLDYTATVNADGSGGDATSALAVVCTFHAVAADLTLTNTGGVPLYLQSFQLRGTPLSSYRAVQASAFDGESIVAHGEYKRTIDLPALGDAALAESYANYLVQRYKAPIGRISAASVRANRDAETMLKVLAMAVGDHILLADSFLNNQTIRYLVTGLTHAISPTATHRLRLTVEPLDRYLYWILGDTTLSVLGTTTRLSI